MADRYEHTTIVVSHTRRVRITAPGWAYGREGTAKPFTIGRGYHVRLYGDRTEYAFSTNEVEAIR